MDQAERRLMFLRIFPSLMFVFLLLAGPAMAGESPRLRILVMGDSLLAAHKLSSRSIGAGLARGLGTGVVDRSVAGARYFYFLPISGSLGLNIKRQFHGENWDWIVLNGGGNDLWFGCGCMRCEKMMNSLISADGRRGVIPGFVSKLRGTGAKVIYLGYLRTPGVTSPIENCKDEGDEFDRRLARLSQLDRGVYFMPLADMVPYGDRTYHAIDLIHPSVKASAEVGRKLVQIIRN